MAHTASNLAGIDRRRLAEITQLTPATGPRPASDPLFRRTLTPQELLLMAFWRQQLASGGTIAADIPP